MFINSLKKPLDYIIFSKKKILNKKLYCTSHSINVPRLELLNGSSIPQIGLGFVISSLSLNLFHIFFIINPSYMVKQHLYLTSVFLIRTWKSEPSLVTNVVEHAIKIGYRHLGMLL